MVVCGGVWWFAVVCGGLRWYVVVCGDLRWFVFSHTALDASFFLGVYSWLVMTFKFNYLILWVRVMGQG